MSDKQQLTKNELNLLRRYLVWCYKTTKEMLDKVDRYFTQSVVDKCLLDELKETQCYKSGQKQDRGFKGYVDDFESYMGKKLKNASNKKFKSADDSDLDPEYCYLKNRFFAIEHAIVTFLGEQALELIETSYEAEMTDRILKAREHI